MASGPITSWQIDGKTVTDFIFWGSKITADGDCSLEIKRLLLLGRKVMTNLDSALKSRDINLSTNVHLVKAVVFPGVMYGCGEGNGTPLQYSCLENPMDEEPGRLQTMGSLELDMTERLHFHFSLSGTGEGNGNPLQCSCLENPRDGSLVGCHLWGHTESDMIDVT